MRATELRHHAKGFLTRPPETDRSLIMLVLKYSFYYSDTLTRQYQCHHTLGRYPTAQRGESAKNSSHTSQSNGLGVLYQLATKNETDACVDWWVSRRGGL